MRFRCAVFLVVASLLLHEGQTASDESSYTAASIQYAPETLPEHPVPSSSEANRQMLKNLASLSEFLVEAKEHGAQILVLPEQGLSGFPFTDRNSVEPYLQEFSEEHTEVCNASVAHRTAQELGTMAHCNNPTKRKQAYRDFTTLIENDSASATLFKVSAASEEFKKYLEKREGYSKLVQVSCIARGMGLTLVVDIALKQPCSTMYPTCPRRGYFQFNSQVALGSTGHILSHYNKNHLYVGESKFFDEPPGRPTLKYFDTDFGVRFGQFICFDIFFHAPPMELHKQLGINNFVFSTYWNNDGSYPLISATQIQQGVSQALGVNLIASNVGYSYLHSGSGIYSEGVPLNTTFVMNDYRMPKLMMSKLPKQPNVRKNFAKEASSVTKHARQGLRMSKQATSDYKLRSFNIRDQPSGIVNVTHGNLTCSLDYTIQSFGEHETFALIALNGYYFYPLLPAQLCSVAVCPSADCSDQKLPIPSYSGSQFSSFTLRGTFSYLPVLPMALASNGSSFDYTNIMNFSSHVENNLHHYQMTMLSDQETWISSAVLYTTNMK